MQKSRKYAKEDLNRIDWIREKCKYINRELIRLGGEEKYNQALNYFDKMFAKLEKEVKALPIGYKYEGTFYLKKPYTPTVEFEKVEGSAYQREDLISWTIKREDGKEDYAYYQRLFKEPNLESEITREIAEPVYQSEEKQEAFA